MSERPIVSVLCGCWPCHLICAVADHSSIPDAKAVVISGQVDKWTSRLCLYGNKSQMTADQVSDLCRLKTVYNPIFNVCL